MEMNGQLPILAALPLYQLDKRLSDHESQSGCHEKEKNLALPEIKACLFDL
jgi:hypothetical protein